jgi:hypothetical protein
LAGSLAGRLSGGSGPILIANLLATWGARCHFGFQAGVSPYVVTGALLESMNDLGPFGWHLSKPADANRPTYNATGFGGGTKPYVSFPTTALYLRNTAISIATDKALTFVKYVVQTPGVTRAQCGARKGADPTLGEVVDAALQESTNRFLSVVTCNGVAEETDTITSPTPTAAGDILVTRYAASIPPALKINGVAATPAHSSSGRSNTVESIALGHSTASGGGLHAWFCIENLTGQEESDLITYLLQ